MRWTVAFTIMYQNKQAFEKKMVTMVIVRLPPGKYGDMHASLQHLGAASGRDCVSLRDHHWLIRSYIRLHNDVIT
jgi:hypothetical protein